jgi:CDP-diacylglycerol---serine O-phosphatidyltransferase
MSRSKPRYQPLPQVIPRGIYLVPSLFTLGNIFCGFYAMVSVMSHYGSKAPAHFFSRAALLILLAAVLDLLDGRIARLTHSTSAFGGQLDSIADVVSFGLAPGLLAYSWALEDFHRMGWLPAFLFLGCGAIRLARFNVLEEEKIFKSSRFFIGLPIPAAAVCISAMVLIEPLIESKKISFLILVSVYILSFLMVSRFRYRSFKDVDWRKRRPVGTLFFIVLILIVVLHEPATMLLLLITSYVLSGVIGYFLPDASLRFFRKLDQIFLGVKILDDAEHHEPEVPEEAEPESADDGTNHDATEPSEMNGINIDE